MAEGFKIADGYVEVHAKYDRSEVDEAAREVGDRSGVGHTRGFTERLRTERGSFVKATESAIDPDGAGRRHGRTMGMGMVKGAVSAFTGSFTRFLTFGLAGTSSTGAAFASNPYTATIGAALALGIVGMAGPLITSGLAIVLSSGAIGLGAWLVRDRPEVQKAAKSLGEVAASVFKTAALPMVTPVVNALNTIKATVIQLSPQFKDMFATVAPYVQPLVDGFMGLVKNAFPGFLTFLKASGPMIQTLAQWLPKIGTALSTMFTQMSKGGPGATKFLGDLLRWITGLIVTIGYLLKWLSQAYLAVSNFFEKQLPRAIQASIQWVTQMWGKITKFFSDLWAEISSWPGKIGTWLAGVGQRISSFVSSVVAWFQALPGRIGAFVASIPGMLQRYFVQAFDLVTFAIGYGIGLVVDFFIRLPGRIMSAIESLKGSLSAFWSFVLNNAKSLVSQGIDNVVSFWRAMPGRVSSAVSSLWSSIVGAFQAAKSGAESLVRSAVDNVVNFFRALPGRAAAALSAVKGAVTGAFAGASSWLFDAGAAILRGVAAGISSATGFVVDAARRAAANIISGFKSALGISSPSKVMAEQVGRWLPAGVAEGVEKGLPDLRKAMRGLLPDAVGIGVTGGAGTPALTVGAATGGQTYVFHEGAIVLDASKLRSVQDLVELVGQMKSTARQFRARGLAGVTA